MLLLVKTDAEELWPVEGFSTKFLRTKWRKLTLTSGPQCGGLHKKSQVQSREEKTRQIKPVESRSVDKVAFCVALRSNCLNEMYLFINMISCWY